MPSFYEWQLIILIATCVALLFCERRLLRQRSALENGAENGAPRSIVSHLSRRYLTVYTIVMGECGFSGKLFNHHRRSYYVSK